MRLASSTTHMRSQYKVPSYNTDDAYITPSKPLSAPSCHSCAFIALYNLYSCLSSDGSVDLEASIYKGLSRHHQTIKDGHAKVSVMEDAPIPNFVTSDVAISSFNLIFKLNSTSVISIELGKAIENYTDQLKALQTIVDISPDRKAGALIHKDDTFYSVGMKKTEGLPPVYSITIMDSHGFAESSMAGDFTGKSFSATFTNIEDAAKCLYIRTPYTLTTTESTDQKSNQCTFEILILKETTAESAAVLALDEAFYVKNIEELL